MSTYPLPSDGVYTFDPPFNGHNHSLALTGTDGTVTLEAKPEGDDTWRSIPNGTVDMTAPHVVRFVGSVDQYRFTLSGASGPVTITESNIPSGQGVNYEATEMTVEPLLRSGPEGFRRIRVDAGEPGFWAGRQFAWEYELILAAGETQVFRFDLPVDVILLDSGITVDDGSLYYRVFRADQITETGTFSTEVTNRAHPLNVTSFAPSYTMQTTAFTDGVSASGGVTIDGGAIPYPTARVRTSGATAQAFLVGAKAGLQRGFPPTSAYVVATQLPNAAGGTKGVISLKFEERDWKY